MRYIRIERQKGERRKVNENLGVFEKYETYSLIQLAPANFRPIDKAPAVETLSAALRYIFSRIHYHIIARESEGRISIM